MPKSVTTADSKRDEISADYLVMAGADVLLKALEDEGVEVVFGYPGGAVLPIYDALFKNNNIKHILVRHEQAAVHAAEGYARSTGKTGVVLVTSGPGATNAVTGLTDALMDSVPVVCLTGQVPTHLIGNDAFQEADTTGITGGALAAGATKSWAHSDNSTFAIVGDGVSISNAGAAADAVSVTASGNDDIGDREVIETKTFLIDIDLILGQLTTDGDDLCNTGNRKDLVAKIEFRIGAEIHRSRGSVR